MIYDCIDITTILLLWDLGLIYIYIYIYIYKYIYINIKGQSRYKVNPDDTQARINFGKNDWQIFLVTDIPRSLLIGLDIHRNEYKNFKDIHSSHLMPTWNKRPCILPSA